MSHRKIRLNEDEQRVVGMAIELYIRLGLGQFSELAQRLDLLQGGRIEPEKMRRIRQLCEEMEELAWDGKPWALDDEETSRYTLTAFALEARMAGRTKEMRWADERIKERAESETLDPRE